MDKRKTANILLPRTGLIPGGGFVVLKSAMTSTPQCMAAGCMQALGGMLLAQAGLGAPRGRKRCGQKTQEAV